MAVDEGHWAARGTIVDIDVGTEAGAGDGDLNGRDVSWYLENPFNLTEVPKTKPADTIITGSKPDLERPQLASAVDRLLQAWLVNRDFIDAAHFFAPESLPCARLEIGSEKPSSATTNANLLKWLEEVAGALPHGANLEASIQDVDYDLSQKVKVSHPNAHSYILVEVSDDLARMSNCTFRSSGLAVSRNASTGEPTFQLETYQAAFQPKHRTGDRGAVVLTWARRDDKWRVVAFSIEQY